MYIICEILTAGWKRKKKKFKERKIKKQNKIQTSSFKERKGTERKKKKLLQ